MRIELRDLDDSGKDFDITFEPDAVDLIGKFSKLGEPARFCGKIVKDEWLTSVQASARVRVKRRCDRCFGPGELEHSVEVDEVYVFHADLSEDREKSLDAKDRDYSVLDNAFVDLKEVFTEQVLVSLPDTFLCSDDCTGLCPVCGQRKDNGDCGCEEDEIDPRWEALRGLK